MNNGWTPERRAMQSKLIKGWKPWKHATGPKSAPGKAKVARNAFRGGKRPALRQAIKALNLYFQTNQDLLNEV